jgi:hypothetical protein
LLVAVELGAVEEGEVELELEIGEEVNEEEDKLDGFEFDGFGLFDDDG